MLRQKHMNSSVRTKNWGPFILFNLQEWPKATYMSRTYIITFLQNAIPASNGGQSKDVWSNGWYLCVSSDFLSVNWSSCALNADKVLVSMTFCSTEHHSLIELYVKNQFMCVSLLLTTSQFHWVLPSVE